MPLAGPRPQEKYGHLELLETHEKNKREVECSGISKQLETKFTNLTGVGSIEKDQSKVLEHP